MPLPFACLIILFDSEEFFKGLKAACHYFWVYSCLFEYSTEVGVTIANDNIFDGCFCGGSEGVNTSSLLKSKLVEELNPSPQWARTSE